MAGQSSIQGHLIERAAGVFPALFRENQKETSGGRFYISELDSLRFFAFLAVFFTHLYPGGWNSRHGILQYFGIAGAFGVDLFFVLSAYLITKLLVRERAAKGTVDVKAFYVRRALRIWPLYFSFLALLLLLISSKSQGPLEIPFRPIQFIAFFAFAGNFAAALAPFFNPMTILWSISVEEQFYIAWPWVARRTSRPGQASFALCLMVSAAIARFLFLAAGYSGAVIWFMTFTRLDSIACGIILAALPEELFFSLDSRRRLGLVLIGAMGWLFAARSHIFESTASAPGITLGYPAVALGSAAFVVAALGASRHSAPFMSNRVLLYLGRISYGLYVFHGIVILLCQALIVRVASFWSIYYKWPAWLGWPLYIAVSLMLTILLASVSYYVLEAPFLRLKRRFTYVPSGRPA